MSPRHRLKGDQRKREIVDAVIDCLAESGIDKMTFEAVGTRVGMERAHVAYHFRTRRDMMEAAIRHVAGIAQAQTKQAVESAQGSRAKLTAIVTAAFDHLYANPKHAATIALFYHLSTHDPKLQKLNHEIRQIGLKRIIGILESFPRKPSGDLEELSKAFQALIVGQLLTYMTTEKGPGSKKLKNETVAACLRLVEGVA